MPTIGPYTFPLFSGELLYPLPPLHNHIYDRTHNASIAHLRLRWKGIYDGQGLQKRPAIWTIKLLHFNSNSILIVEIKICIWHNWMGQSQDQIGQHYMWSDLNPLPLWGIRTAAPLPITRVAIIYMYDHNANSVPTLASTMRAASCVKGARSCLPPSPSALCFCCCIIFLITHTANLYFVSQHQIPPIPNQNLILNLIPATPKPTPKSNGSKINTLRLALFNTEVPVGPPVPARPAFHALATMALIRSNPNLKIWRGALWFRRECFSLCDFATNGFVLWHNPINVVVILLPNDVVVSTKCSELCNGELLVIKYHVIFFSYIIMFIVFWVRDPFLGASFLQIDLLSCQFLLWWVVMLSKWS